MEKINKKIAFIFREYRLFIFLAVFAVISTVISKSAVPKITTYEKLTEQSAEPSNYVFEKPLSSSDGAENNVPYINDVKTLKEYKGKIGVYNNSGILEYSLDIPTDSLPISDKLMLRDGITVNSDAELCEFIENLNS